MKRRRSRVSVDPGSIVRRDPQQQRSKARSERILQVAARLFVELGYESVTTNKIAASAKVSIGAIYQYFENKDAIALALRKQLGQAELEQLEIAIEDARGIPIETAILQILDRLIAERIKNASLRKVLVEQTAILSSLDWVSYSDSQLSALLADVLQNHSEVHVQDPFLAATMILTATENITNRLMISSQGMWETKTVRDALARWILRGLNNHPPHTEEPCF